MVNQTKRRRGICRPPCQGYITDCLDKMGRSKKADKKKKPAVKEDDGGLVIDPARIRFQHSKIRPYFSGCGRSVEATLESIRQKEISPSDLPPILVRLMHTNYFKLSATYFTSSFILFVCFLQVIVGPDTADGPWYFGLNSRRLWVLKRCREEGLLENNRIYVRVRECKSDAEAVRYSIENCALEAKIVPDPEKRSGEERKSQDAAGKASTKVVEDSSEDDSNEGCTSKSMRKKKSKEVAAFENLKIDGGGSSGEDSDSDDEPVSSSNRFSALF